MIELRHRQSTSSIGGDIFRGLQMRVREKKASGGPFLAYRTRFLHLTLCEYLENGKSQRYMSRQDLTSP